MTVSFTQTYGNGRKLLLDIYSRDNKLIEFKNLFDLNLYSFHNSSKETIEYFKSINKVKNTEIIEFNDISYGQCIKNLIEKLDSLNCTHFFFSQDDTFSANNDNIDFNNLLSYFKSHENNFMYCFHLNKNGFKHRQKLAKINNFNIYDHNTTDFEISGLDDKPYICTIDILKKIYDSEYTAYDNIWDAEMFLHKKFKHITIPRYYGDDSLFVNYFIVGKHKSVNYEDALKLKGLL
jgi:hypothetical protein